MSQESYACINYCRHKVPIDVVTQCSIKLRQSTTAFIYKAHNQFESDNDCEIEYEITGNYYIDIYIAILSALRADTEHQYFFLIENDIEYNSSHFSTCLDAIKKNPDKIICNKNLFQKLENTYRKNLDYIRPLSSLSGHKQTLVKAIEDKIQEIVDYDGVNWLEPGYNREGNKLCIDVASTFPILEIRHQFSSTALSNWIVKPPSEPEILSLVKDKNNKTKIALLGLISHFEPQYSVSTCIMDQLNLLSRHYHDLVFIVPSDFRDIEKIPLGVEIRKIPRYHGDPDKDTVEKIDEFVKDCSEQLNYALKDVTVCIEHDGIFLDCFVPYNAAIRNVAASRPGLKWIHWIHSAPNLAPPPEKYPKSLLRMPMGNSTFISLNETNRIMLSQMYNMNSDDVIFAPNIVDPVSVFNFHPLTKELYYDHQLWAQDIICIYPARTVDAKQPDKIIKLLAACKKQGQKVKFIYCNSYSNGESEINYLESLINLAKAEDFEQNFIPTSTFLSAWCRESNYSNNLGVPHEVVLDLMKISDLFILPSISEGCSLIMLEAALHKNLLILNDDLDTLHDFGGQKINEHESEKALYFRFGSIKTPIHNFDGNESKWYQEKAKILINQINKEKSIQFFKFIRKNHSPDYVFNHYLKKLLN